MLVTNFYQFFCALQSFELVTENTTKLKCVLLQLYQNQEYENTTTTMKKQKQEVKNVNWTIFDINSKVVTRYNSG